MPPSDSAALRRAVAALLVLASLLTAAVLYVRSPGGLVALLPSPDMRELHVDFDTFRLSAVALLEGGDIYDTPAKLTNLNPPLLSVLLTPFAALDALVAYRIFAVLMLLCVVGAVVVVARELRLRPAVTVAVVLTVLASSPLHGALLLGQIYPLLLAGLVGGWLAERRARPVLAAVLFGITVALKPSLAPLLLLPAVQQRWVPMRAGMAAAVVATLVGVLVAGPSSGWEWLRIAATEPVPDTGDNASLPGLAVRFGLPSMVGLLLGAAVLAGTLWWCASRRERIDPAGTAPWAVLAAGLLCSPIAWHNYLMLLWPGVLVLMAVGRAAAAAVALAVTVIPVSWGELWPPDARWSDVGMSLYCAVLLGYWLLLASSATRRSPGSPGSPEAGPGSDPPVSAVPGSRTPGSATPSSSESTSATPSTSSGSAGSASGA